MCGGGEVNLFVSLQCQLHEGREGSLLVLFMAVFLVLGTVPGIQSNLTKE